MEAMDQEFITPDRSPKSGEQAFGTFGIFIAAAVASVWAFSKMLGFPDIAIELLLVLVVIPILMATVWTASRAWHVEQRLARGQDIDTPVFKTLYYLRQKS